MKIKLKSVQELLDEGFAFNQDGSTLRRDSENKLIGSLAFKHLGKTFDAEKCKDGKFQCFTYDSSHKTFLFSNEYVKEIIQDSDLLNLIERQEIYEVACKKWGLKGQIVAAIEELSELQVELAKHFNCKRDDKKGLIDELADASIMIEQQILNFKIEKDVKERVDYKVKRLRQILGMD